MNSTDAVVDKIKKCLRLARKAGTEGEKVAAEIAAKRIAEANGIALEDVRAEGENEAKTVVERDDKLWRRRGCEIGFIVTILREHFGVVALQHYRTRGTYCHFTFFGNRLNIDVAKYVFQILWRESDLAWKAARREDVKMLTETAEMAGYAIPRGFKFKSRMKKDSFMRGWFTQIHIKLTEHPLRNDIEQFKQEKEAAERKYQEYKEEAARTDHPVTQKTKKDKREDSESLYMGYVAASKVSLNRPCEGRETASPFALGHTAQLKGGL